MIMGHVLSVKNWLKEMTSPYDFCLSLDSSAAGPESESGPQVLKTRNNRIISLQRRSDERLYSDVIFSRLKYSFFSPLLYAQTVTIKTRKRTLLDFAVRRYIKQLHLFEKDFHFCYDVLSFNGDSAVVNLYVLSPGDATEIINGVPHDTKPVHSLIPLEYVLTELLSDTFKNPVVSVWGDSKQVLILTTRGKEILSRMVYAYDSRENEIDDWLLANEYIQQAMASAKRISPDEDVSLLVWGEYYKRLQETLQRHPDLRIDEYLEQKISDKLDWSSYFGGFFKGKTVHPRAVRTRQEPASKSLWSSWMGKRKRSSLLTNTVCKEVLFSNPLLYGLSVCKESQTFISMTYKSEYTRYMRVRFSLIVSLLVCLAFIGLGTREFFSQSEIKADIENKTASVESGIKQITDRIPDNTLLTEMVEKAKIKRELSSELDVKHFLGWITNIAPEKSVIDQLLIEVVIPEATAPNAEDRNRKVQNVNDGIKQYSVRLNLSIDRTYSDSVVQIDTFFTRLNERVKSPQSKFVYTDINDKIPSAMSLTFLVDPERFL